MNDNLATYNNITIASQQEFADVIPIIYAPFEDYVIKVIPLMLEHVWHQKEVKHTTASEELMQSGWIGRLITLDSRVLNRDQQNEIIGWPAIRDYLVKCLNECPGELQLSEIVEKCMKHVRPIVEKRFDNNYHFPQRMFHCWWYTVHDNNTRLALHLVNTYQPDSPFDHLNHFLSTMMEAVEHAVMIYPGIKTVSCGSWLNQLSKFQDLWPESFQHNQKVVNETGGFGPGTWGQYMTTQGKFNEAKAAILRKEGKHPFALTEASSTIGEVLMHLKKLVR